MCQLSCFLHVFALALCATNVSCGDWDARVANACDPNAQGLLINEWLANPKGPDASREWVELFNARDVPICFGRAQWRVHTTSGTQKRWLSEAGCLAPGAFLLLGDGTRASRNAVGGYAVDVHLGHVELPNTGATLEVTCQDATLARVSYGDDGLHASVNAPSPLAGRSTARIVSPDQSVAYCNVSAPPYDGRDIGSPHAQNLSCHVCSDEGLVRAQQLAAPGDIALTATYADPPGADRNKEWVRLTSRASSAIDLHGLTLDIDVPSKRARHLSLFANGCATLAPGATWQVPVVDAASTAHAPSVFVGPTLPNEGALYRLMQKEQTLFEAYLEAPEGHACVLPRVLTP